MPSEEANLEMRFKDFRLPSGNVDEAVDESFHDFGVLRNVQFFLDVGKDLLEVTVADERRSHFQVIGNAFQKINLQQNTFPKLNGCLVPLFHLLPLQ